MMNWKKSRKYLEGFALEKSVPAEKITPVQTAKVGPQLKSEPVKTEIPKPEIKTTPVPPPPTVQPKVTIEAKNLDMNSLNVAMFGMDSPSR